MTASAPPASGTAVLIAGEPGAAGQWHLHNTGQAGGFAGIDLNILPAWRDATGLGVRIGIIDDGFDLAHRDLATNFAGGRDLLAGDDDPSAEGFDRHGTTTAGVIGADDNRTGLLGVAPDAQLFGFRVGFGTQPIAQFADAMALQRAMDVSSNSWGFTDAFADDFAAPAFLGLAAAIADAAAAGRGGLGTVMVAAAGNDRTRGDSVNHHNLLNNEYMMAIAALDAAGAVAPFSNPGAALFAAAPGVAVLTTDRSGPAGYAPGDTAIMSGTSYAAPMVAGIAALLIEAEPRLGYRDIQAIIAASARPIDPDSPTWTANEAGTWNGGGHLFSTDLGFGLVDATAALRLAETWFATGGAPATAANRAIAYAVDEPFARIPDGNEAGLAVALTVADDLVIERIELAVGLSHTWIGDLTVRVVSPGGTESVLLDRPGRAPGTTGPGSRDDGLAFTFSSNAFRGETAAGTWTVRVADHATGEDGVLHGLTLRAVGTWPSEDNRYVFTDAFAQLAGAGRDAIADAGGIDTLNASAVGSNLVIDLDTGASLIGGAPLSIAAGTVIEHALGGDGDDRIIGNAAGNILWGGRGADTLVGLAGDDVLRGGPGDDWLDGGAGHDRALFDGPRAAARFGWEGGVLLVTDEGGTDRLRGIEELLFTDATVDVASLAPVGALPAISVAQGLAGPWAMLAPPPAGGTAAVGAAALGLPATPADAQVRLATDADGSTSLAVASAWNSVKVARVNDTDGGRLTVANFVEVAITHGGTAPGRIEVLDAKRGSITAGGGDDAIIVRAFSNGPGVGNGFTIAAGGGDDVITLAGHGALSQFRVSAGAGNDRITITGGGADEVNGGDGDDRIDAGGGNDRLTGGAGADLFVFRVGSGRDQVLDFTDGIDRLLFEGVGAAALAFSAVTGGVRVAWGSDEVVLRGAALAGIDLADCVFA